MKPNFLHRLAIPPMRLWSMTIRHKRIGRMVALLLIPAITATTVTGTEVRVPSLYRLSAHTSVLSAEFASQALALDPIASIREGLNRSAAALAGMISSLLKISGVRDGAQKSLLPIELSQQAGMLKSPAMTVKELKDGIIYTGLLWDDLSKLSAGPHDKTGFYRIRIRYVGRPGLSYSDGKTREFLTSHAHGELWMMKSTFTAKVDPQDPDTLEIIQESTDDLLTVPWRSTSEAPLDKQMTDEWVHEAIRDALHDLGDEGEITLAARLLELTGHVDLVVRFGSFRYPEQTIFPDETDTPNGPVEIRLHRALLLPGQRQLLKIAILKAVTNIMEPERDERYTLRRFLIAAVGRHGMGGLFTAFESLLPGASPLLLLLQWIVRAPGLEDIMARGKSAQATLLREYQGTLKKLVDWFVQFHIPKRMKGLHLLPVELGPYTDPLAGLSPNAQEILRTIANHKYYSRDAQAAGLAVERIGKTSSRGIENFIRIKRLRQGFNELAAAGLFLRKPGSGLYQTTEKGNRALNLLQFPVRKPSADLEDPAMQAAIVRFLQNIHDPSRDADRRRLYSTMIGPASKPPDKPLATWQDVVAWMIKMTRHMGTTANKVVEVWTRHLVELYEQGVIPPISKTGRRQKAKTPAPQTQSSTKPADALPKERREPRVDAKDRPRQILPVGSGGSRKKAAPVLLNELDYSIIENGLEYLRHPEKLRPTIDGFAGELGIEISAFSYRRKKNSLVNDVIQALRNPGSQPAELAGLQKRYAKAREATEMQSPVSKSAVSQTFRRRGLPLLIGGALALLTLLYPQTTYAAGFGHMGDGAPIGWAFYLQDIVHVIERLFQSDFSGAGSLFGVAVGLAYSNYLTPESIKRELAELSPDAKDVLHTIAHRKWFREVVTGGGLLIKRLTQVRNPLNGDRIRKGLYQLTSAGYFLVNNTLMIATDKGKRALQFLSFNDRPPDVRITDAARQERIVQFVRQLTDKQRHALPQLTDKQRHALPPRLGRRAAQPAEKSEVLARSDGAALRNAPEDPSLRNRTIEVWVARLDKAASQVDAPKGKSLRRRSLILIIGALLSHWLLNNGPASRPTLEAA